MYSDSTSTASLLLQGQLEEKALRQFENFCPTASRAFHFYLNTTVGFYFHTAMLTYTHGNNSISFGRDESSFTDCQLMK
jgi:hypothetical protein